MNKFQGVFYMTVLLTLGFLWTKLPKPMAVVDIKGITDEFLQLTARAELAPDQMDKLAQKFSIALEMGVEELSDDYMLVAKRAVVSEELDLTGELRDYIAARITKGSEK